MTQDVNNDEEAQRGRHLQHIFTDLARPVIGARDKPISALVERTVREREDMCTEQSCHVVILVCLRTLLFLQLCRKKGTFCG
jgi:hypothetical protein